MALLLPHRLNETETGLPTFKVLWTPSLNGGGAPLWKSTRERNTWPLLKKTVAYMYPSGNCIVCLIGPFPRCPMQGTHGCHQHGTSGRDTFPCRLYGKGQNLCFHFCQFPMLRRQAKDKALLIPGAVWRKFSSFTCVKKVKSHYWQRNFNQLETKLTATLIGLYKVT